MPGLICLREKLWTRTYSIRDQVPTCPVFTRAKIKSRFGILVNLPSHWAIELVSERYIVSLLNRVVEVKPTYILLLSEIQSPKGHLNWYIYTYLEKGAFWLPLTKFANFTFLHTYIYIYIYIYIFKITLIKTSWWL